MVRRALPVLFAAATAFALPAQHEAPDPGHSAHGEAFDEGPRGAATLMPGMSPQVHFPVAGLTAEAQAFFDQGVCQQHGFWYFEAERSFRQVALLHPDCAMAYWGMAMANVENGKRAAGLIANAVVREATAPASEKAWIDAFATFYGIDDKVRGELQSGDAARVKAAIAPLGPAVDGRDRAAHESAQKRLIKDLGTIVHDCPDDIEAKAFLALQIWLAYDWGSGVPIVSHTAVDALLDQVFAKAPLHPAHHYRIHLWDQEDAARALPSAALDGAAGPGIAHLWHMAGHIYDKLHRHREAAWQQEASGRTDHAYMMRDAVMPFLIHNYGHNQEWLARSLSYVGRADEALAVAENLAELPRHPKWNDPDDARSIAGYARTRLVQVCEDYELWADAVRLCRDSHLEPSDAAAAEVPRLTLLGRALFRLGRKDEAAQVVADADALLQKARARRATAIDDAETVAFAKKADGNKVKEAIAEAARVPTDAVEAVLNLQRELKGERLLADGDAAAALAEFEAVKDFPKTLLADAMVAAKQPARAVEVLEAEVKARPNRVATEGRLFLAMIAVDAVAGDHAHRDRIHELMARLPWSVDGAKAANPFVDRLGIGASACGGRLATPAPVDPTADFPPDFGTRPPLASLGPARWRPTPAPGFDLPCADGGHRTLATGRPTLVVFYLGFGCLHCVQQLQALSPRAKDFAAAGIDVVAIGNEALAATREKLDALGKERFAFPLLADPELVAFRAWHCHDDFERAPLHGTFLVDAQGRVRWQDISYEPFPQIDWLLREAQRLLALPMASGTH